MSRRSAGSRLGYVGHRRAASLPGGTRRAVDKAIDEGRVDLPVILSGDYAAADAQWLERTNQRKGKGPRPGTKRPSQDGPKRAGTRTMNRVQLDRMSMRKEREAIELAALKGTYVNAQDVSRAWCAEGRRLRDLLLALPARVVPDLLVVFRREMDDGRAVAAAIPILDTALRATLAGLDSEPTT